MLYHIITPPPETDPRSAFSRPGSGIIPPPNSPVTPKPSPPPSPSKDSTHLTFAQSSTMEGSHLKQDTEKHLSKHQTVNEQDQDMAAVKQEPDGEKGGITDEGLSKDKKPIDQSTKYRAWYEEDGLYFKSFVTDPSQIGPLHPSMVRKAKEPTLEPEPHYYEEDEPPQKKATKKEPRVVIPGERKSRRFVSSKSPSPLVSLATPPKNKNPKSNVKRRKPKYIPGPTETHRQVCLWFDALCELELCYPGQPHMVDQKVLDFRMALELAKHGDELSATQIKMLKDALNGLEGFKKGNAVAGLDDDADEEDLDDEISDPDSNNVDGHEDGEDDFF